MTSLLYLALLALAAPLAFAAGWRARSHRSLRIEVPRALVTGGRRRVVEDVERGPAEWLRTRE